MTPDSRNDLISNLVEQRFSRYPAFKAPLKAKVEGMGLCYMDAFSWLREFEEGLKLSVPPLTVNSHDQEIKDAAEAISKHCHRVLRNNLQESLLAGKTSPHRIREVVTLAESICIGADVIYPVTERKRETKAGVVSAIKRLACPKWWRRQIRSLQARKLETVCRHLGMVCRKRGGYVSGVTLHRRSTQKRRNRDLLESLVAINDDDQVFTLAELSDLGVSNPKNRRAELMTRIRGFEEWADQHKGYQALLLTGTAPSRFHSHNAAGIQNPKWDYSTPRDAQAWLCERWALFRSAIDRAGLHCFGFRVAEPHHDGCPHWHLLLWVPENRHSEFYSLFNDYWRGIGAGAHSSAGCDGYEPGADERRTDCVVINLTESKRPHDHFCGPMPRQTATGYVSKYICKNVDGLTAQGSEFTAGAVKTALRVEAWASTWGIRQFQPIGGPSVSVWRELRRIDAERMDLEQDYYRDTKDSEDIEILATAREAAISNDWKSFTDVMGGALLPRSERPLKVWIENKLNEAKAVTLNAYGELIARIVGLMAHQAPLKTRIREWTVKSVHTIQAEAAPAAEALTGPPRRATLGLV